MDFSQPAKSPALALGLAELLNAVSSPAGSHLIDSRLSAAFGEPPVSYQVHATENRPAYYAARVADYSFLLIAGCSTLSHANGTTDGFRGATLGPIDEPVNEYFRATGEAIGSEVLANGLLAGEHVILVGHSLGGASIEHVAQSLILSGMGDKLKLITFGAPKPGGAAFASAVSGIDRARYFCADDPVPLLPPTADLLPSILLAQTPIQLMRFTRFVHPRGGIQITVDSNIGKATLPENASLNATGSLAGWLLAVDGSSSSGHHLTTYQSRLAYYLQRNPGSTPSGVEVAGAEEPGDQSRVGFTKQQRQAGNMLADLAQEQHALPVVIPDEKRFTYQRSGRYHLVTFAGTTVVATSRERSARALAREGNEWLRLLQRQAVVMTDELAAQFTAYLRSASSAEGGFVPVMNKELPELPP